MKYILWESEIIGDYCVLCERGAKLFSHYSFLNFCEHTANESNTSLDEDFMNMYNSMFVYCPFHNANENNCNDDHDELTAKEIELLNNHCSYINIEQFSHDTYNRIEVYFSSLFMLILEVNIADQHIKIAQIGQFLVQSIIKALKSPHAETLAIGDFMDMLFDCKEMPWLFAKMYVSMTDLGGDYKQIYETFYYDYCELDENCTLKCIDLIDPCPDIDFIPFIHVRNFYCDNPIAKLKLLHSLGADTFFGRVLKEKPKK